MILKTMFAGLCMLSLVGLGAAQNKISGTTQCAKPDVQQQVDVSDHPGHSISIMQMKCTWTKPLELEGVKSKDGTDSGAVDMHGPSGSSHGYYVDNMENGDKAFVHWQGKEGKEGSEGKWTYNGGTGKFKGLKGGGTYKSKRADDGSSTVDVEGEYTLAAK